MIDRYNEPIVVLIEPDGDVSYLYSLDDLLPYLTCLPAGITVRKLKEKKYSYEESYCISDVQVINDRLELFRFLQKTFPYAGEEVDSNNFHIEDAERYFRAKDEIRSYFDHSKGW